MQKRAFQMVLGRRNDLLHQKAIWQEVLAHLKKFVDTDAAPARQGIMTDGGGLTVPQAVIEAVMVDVENSRLSTIIQELETIDNSEVAENVREESKESAKAEPKGRKGKGVSRSKGRS